MADGCEAIEPRGSAWLDGALDAQEAATVRAHLATCASCRADLDDLARTRALLRSMPVRRMPPELLADVPADAGGLRDQPVPPPPVLPDDPGAPRRGGVAPRVAAAALAVVGVLGGAAFSLGDRSPEVRTVSVPVDLFVADHVAQTVQAPVWSPVLLEATQ